MAESVARIFIVAAQQVHEKHVFPGTPAHRTRLDLAQTDVAQREYAQRFEQRSRNILHAESQRSLIGATSRAWLPALDQKETSEVLLVILDAGLQNSCSINLGSPPTGNSGRVAQPLRHHMLHAACGV